MFQSQSQPTLVTEVGCPNVCCLWKKYPGDGTSGSCLSSQSKSQYSGIKRSLSHAVLRTTPLPTQKPQITRTKSSVFTTNNYTYHILSPQEEEFRQATVIQVYCKGLGGELHKSKFAASNKGDCIRKDGRWVTPTQFVAECGGSNPKDWRKIIRTGGISLQEFINKELLRVHARGCECTICMDGTNTIGGRRSKQAKRTRTTENSVGSSTSGSAGIAHLPVGPLARSAQKLIGKNYPAATDVEGWKKLEDEVQEAVNMALNLKNLMQVAKEKLTKAAQLAAPKFQHGHHTDDQAQEPSPVANNRQNQTYFWVQTEEGRVLDPTGYARMQENLTNFTVYATALALCGNNECGRELPSVDYLECSYCHSVQYCNPFCKWIDSENHQANCRRQEVRLFYN